MKKLSITSWIMIGMVAGIALGVFAPAVAVNLAPISNVFLRLIKSIIAPLLFGTLVYGIAGSGDESDVQQIGLSQPQQQSCRGQDRDGQHQGSSQGL